MNPNKKKKLFFPFESEGTRQHDIINDTSKNEIQTYMLWELNRKCQTKLEDKIFIDFFHNKLKV